MKGGTKAKDKRRLANKAVKKSSRQAANKTDLPEAFCLVNSSQLEQAQLCQPFLGSDCIPLLLVVPVRRCCISRDCTPEQVYVK